MTLETQYKSYKIANPESNLTFEEWKVQLGHKLEKAITEINLDELTNKKVMPKTAIEWFVEQLPLRIVNSYLEEIEKAKAMEADLLIEELIGFQLFLNEENLIVDHDWDYEAEAKRYYNNSKK